MKKRLISLLLVVVMAFGFVIPGYASGETDESEYDDAVSIVQFDGDSISAAATASETETEPQQSETVVVEVSNAISEPEPVEETVAAAETEEAPAEASETETDVSDPAAESEETSPAADAPSEAEEPAVDDSASADGSDPAADAEDAEQPSEPSEDKETEPTTEDEETDPADDAVDYTSSGNGSGPVTVWDGPGMEDVELTGNYALDLLAIAQTQLGYEEDASGYTKYGDWYGIPYGGWCAMFVSYCLNYAGIPEDVVPRSAACDSWADILAGGEYDLYIPASSGYTPKPGDIIFYDWNNNGSADHVGIVAALSDAEYSSLTYLDREAALADTIAAMKAAMEGEDAAGEEAPEYITVVTIEGNYSDRVQTVAYALDADCILGYGVLPENEESGASETASDFGGMDFSSRRLLIGGITEDDIMDAGTVIGTYDGVYLLQFESEEATWEAYNYYTSLSGAVDVDVPVVVADEADVLPVEEQTIEAVPLTETDNPLTALTEIVESGAAEEVQTAPDAKVVVLIDTGVGEDVAVSGAYSVIGDNVYDENGHGTAMAAVIRSVNPDAEIISIKALDENGYGTVSSIYAAIQLAMELNADIINMSFYGVRSSDNSILETIINDAAASGISVVGAAGNSGSDASGYIPGAVEAAIIVGSANEYGMLQPFSNYGDTVDYYVTSDSTSVAAATISGILTKPQDDDFSILCEGVFDKLYTSQEEYEQAKLAEGIGEDGFHTAWSSSYVGTTYLYNAGNGGHYYPNGNSTGDYYVIYDGWYRTSICVDPKSAGPSSGSYSVYKLDIASDPVLAAAIITSYYSNNNTNTVDYACLRNRTYPYWEDVYSSCYWGQLIDNNYGYSLYHELLGYLMQNWGWGQSQLSADSSYRNNVRTTANALWNYFYPSGSNFNQTWYDALFDYEVYYVYTGSSTQRIMWAIPAPRVNLTLYKTCDSNYLDVLDGSTCYDLAGTQYGVYQTYDDAYNKTNCYATVTFDSYGKPDKTVKVRTGTTYYLRELAAGTGYTLSNTITSVAVGTSDLSKTLSDIPGNDPATITLYKTSKAGTTAKPLTGAVFSVDFYSGYYDTVEEAEASVRTDTMLKRCDVDGDGYITYADVTRLLEYEAGKVSSIATGSGDVNGDGSVTSYDATILMRYLDGTLDGITEHRTWYLQTVYYQGKYRANFDIPGSLITSGTYKSDELYRDLDGDIRIPYGTIVIREVKAADYYLNDPDFKDTEGHTYGDTYIYWETPDNGAVSVNTGNSLNPEFNVYDTLQPEMVTKLAGDLGYTSQPVSNSTLKDTMSLSYLHDFVGKYVTITGSLHYQDTGEPVLDATTGRAVTASKTVYISATEQTVVQVFNFDATDCCNREVVCYEIFYYDGTEIMRHEDATDENQIVWYEKIGPGSLLVTKKTTAGSPLAGASYLLEYSNDSGTTWQPVYSYSDGPKNGYVAGGCDSAGLVDGVLTTGADGKASFTGLLADGKVQYRLTEVGTPSGYSLMKESIYVGTLPIWADDSGGLNIAAGSGDLNGDGKVSGRDFRLLMKYVGGEQSVTIVPGSGDVNGDGQTDMKDALRLLKYVGNTDSETAFNKQFVVNFDVRNGVVDIPMTGDSGFHWWPFACSGVLVAVGMLAVTDPNRKRRKARG